MKFKNIVFSNIFLKIKKALMSEGHRPAFSIKSRKPPLSIIHYQLSIIPKALIIPLLFAFCLCLSAQPVSPDEAAQRARSFFHDQTPSGRKYAAQPLTLSHTALSGTRPLFYIFNRQGGGWTIIGGDECCRQVIAFSDYGTFRYDRLESNTLDWIRLYESQITSAIMASDYQPTSADSVALGADISPLTGTEWSQESPFNDLAPKVSGDMCPIGCTALTVAQIMKYHQWPASGVGSHSYFDPGSQQTLSAKFDDRDYQWDVLVDKFYDYYTTLDKPEFTARRAALAQLLYDAAVAVETEFSPSGSSSNLTMARQALTNYFQYDPSTIHQYVASNYTPLQWRTILYNELSAKRPIIYAAVDSTVGGHAFICDGYRFLNSTHYFNFKWGWRFWDWSGTFSGPDGYYALDALNPNGTYSFSSSQHAIVGIKPRKLGYASVVNIAEPFQTIYPTRLGGHVLLPSHADAGAPFVGWTDTRVEEPTVQPPNIIPVGYYTPTADVTLYPLFAYPTHNADSSTTALAENFSDISSGGYVINGRWMGNSNFPCTLSEKNVFAWKSEGMIALGWQGDGVITSKSIPVRPGSPFTVSFSLKGYQFLPYPLTVNVDGHEFDVSTSHTYFDTSMERFSYTFLAQHESINVTFSIEGSLDRYVFLDSISIETGGNTPLYVSSYTTLSVPLTVTDARWATFCAPFSVNLEPGLKAYTVSEGIDGLVLNLVADGASSTDNRIPAHTPVLLNHPSGSAYSKNYSGNYASSLRPDTTHPNLLVGSIPPVAALAPTDGPLTNYVLQRQAGKVGWYSVVYSPATSTFNSLPAFHAYLSTKAPQSEVHQLLDPLTTSLQNTIIDSDDASPSSLRNIQGQSVTPDYRGIVIRNGRKYLRH